MTTYKDIYGTNIEVLSSDPAKPSIGQIWYNSTTNLVKANVKNPIVFDPVSNMPNPFIYMGSAGSTSFNSPTGGYNGVGIVTGQSPASSPQQSMTYQAFNGGQGSWSLGNTWGTVRYATAGAGGYATGVFAGGRLPNGSSTSATDKNSTSDWTSNPSGLNTARYFLGAAGVQTAAVFFGGSPSDNTSTTATENFNGSTWTNNPSGLNTSRMGLAGSGINTSALAVGGTIFPGEARANATELFNGSTWTNKTSMTNVRSRASGNGSSSSFIVPGGNNPAMVAGTTERYNGTSWTTLSATMLNGRYGNGTMGDGATAGITFGGTPGNSDTERYQGGPAVVTLS